MKLQNNVFYILFTSSLNKPRCKCMACGQNRLNFEFHLLGSALDIWLKRALSSMAVVQMERNEIERGTGDAKAEQTA